MVKRAREPGHYGKPRGVRTSFFFACANEWGQLVLAPALCVDTDRNVMEKVLLPIFFLHMP